VAGLRRRHLCHRRCVRSHPRLIIQNDSKNKLVLRAAARTDYACGRIIGDRKVPWKGRGPARQGDRPRRE
jgi:hypothetical protein